jgi:ATP-dependent DNA helicase Q4
MTSVAVARIFHGLATPAFPAQQWAKCGFWGHFTGWDFGAIEREARVQLAQFKRANANTEGTVS